MVIDRTVCEIVEIFSNSRTQKIRNINIFGMWPMGYLGFINEESVNSVCEFLENQKIVNSNVTSKYEQ